MEITHISNSFISIKINKSIIACDPWVGTTSDNAWLAYPYYKKGKNVLNNINPNFIYISHLHGDHLDPKTLSKFKKKNVKIIIKKFSNKRLKNKIKKIGFKNIIECAPWKKYRLNDDISICIIPQMSSNSSEIEEQINYDLDTSILIQCNKTKKIFFNNVDNPLSIKDLKKIKKSVKKILNSGIDVVCFPVGAASEYPHCFMNIIKKKEKNKIISSSLKKLKVKLKIIKPKVFFPAGGSYLIYGKFSKLNKYIAQPAFNEIKHYLKEENYNVFDIEGGSKISQSKNVWFRSNKNNQSNYLFDENKIINVFRRKKYFYSTDFNNIKLKSIDNIFNESANNYQNSLKKFPIKTKWKIEFLIYKNLSLNSFGKIEKKTSKFLKKYIIKNYSNNISVFKQRYSKLRCHLDYNLFYGLLKRKYIWNTALSGSVILFDRTPNIFDPNLTFSINFLAS